MREIWNWYYGKASIRTKLVLSYLFLVLLPILGLGVYSYHISTENLLDQTKQTIEANISSMSYSLNSSKPSISSTSVKKNPANTQGRR